LITDVEPNGVAAGAGLRSGWLILARDRSNGKTVEEVQRAPEQGSLEKGLLLQVRTLHGGTAYVLLEAPSSR
jgi:predicted metalloprotease with PDZ domain